MKMRQKFTNMRRLPKSQWRQKLRLRSAENPVKIATETWTEIPKKRDKPAENSIKTVPKTAKYCVKVASNTSSKTAKNCARKTVGNFVKIAWKTAPKFAKYVKIASKPPENTRANLRVLLFSAAKHFGETFAGTWTKCAWDRQKRAKVASKTAPEAKPRNALTFCQHLAWDGQKLRQNCVKNRLRSPKVHQRFPEIA